MNYTTQSVHISKNTVIQVRESSAKYVTRNTISNPSSKNPVQIWVTDDKGNILILRNGLLTPNSSIQDVTLYGDNLDTVLHDLEKKMGIILYEKDRAEYLYTSRVTKEAKDLNTDIYLVTLDLNKDDIEFLQERYDIDAINFREIEQRIANNDRSFYEVKDTVRTLLNIMHQKFD